MFSGLDARTVYGRIDRHMYTNIKLINVNIIYKYCVSNIKNDHNNIKSQANKPFIEETNHLVFIYSLLFCALSIFGY